MDIYFIVNEKSGNGNGKKVWDEFKDQLKIQFIEHTTQYSGHALKLSQAISEKYIKNDQGALIVAVGGDGTIHEVLNGVVFQSNVYIGYVKAGSGNDFARAFPIFRNAQDVKQFIKNPHGVKMDCGQVLFHESSSRRFVNNAGIGFDAYVARKANLSKFKGLLNKIGLGKLSYGISTVIALFSFKRFTVELSVDGVPYQFQKVWFVTVSNQPYFGGGMNLSPESKTNDGELEITIVHDLAHIKLLFLFGSVFSGTHTKLPNVTQLKGKYFNVRVTDSLYFHADGEIIGSTDSRNLNITYQILNDSWTSVNIDRISK